VSVVHSLAPLAVRALLVCFVLPAFALAQGLEFQTPVNNDPAALDRAMAHLARQVMWAPERRTGTSANDLIWIQTAAGWYAEAQAIIDAGRPAGAQFGDAAMAPIELYVRAKARPADFEREFVQTFEKLDDKTAHAAAAWFMPPPLQRLRDQLYGSIQKQGSAERITLGDAVELCRRYVLLRVYESIAPVSGRLIEADRTRRYIIDDVLVKTPDGATINAVVVRPKRSAAKLPALLEFTIYTHPDAAAEGVRAASRGYIGVTGYTRGKRLSPDPVVPFERDGDDARALIDWISRQPWSDGRVGMHGGSYNGFTQWAAVKRLPRALKTIVPCCPNNPGFGLPMNNNVFLTPNYGWVFYAATGKYLDDEVYSNSQRWQQLPWNWYRSGRPYREIDRVDGHANPWLQRWLQHPAYDAYWQGMTAEGRD
jgi:uncharacterized protein